MKTSFLTWLLYLMRLHLNSCFILSMLLVVLGAQVASAQSYRQQEKEFQPFLTRGETTWSIGAGIRNNKTGWRDSSDITGTVTPNIETENTFDDVTFFELKGKVRHVEPANIGFINGGIQAEAEITGGIIVDGFSQLSRYAGDNRTAEFLRRSTNSLGGDAIGGNVSLGYKINLTGTPGREAKRIMATNPRTVRGRMRKARALRAAMDSPGPYLSITPLAGYGIDQQSYTIEDVFQVIPAFTAFGTDAEYISNWYGPFFGLEGEFKNKKHMVRVRGQYHDLSYDAEFIDKPGAVNFEQEADGDGVTLNAEYAYALADDYAITFEGFFQSRSTDEGTEKQRVNGADAGTVLLHEIDDESHALRLGLRYNWD